jgi:hypothetical protein
LQRCPDDYAVRGAIREFVLDSYAMGRPLTPRFRDDLKATAKAAVAS